jgi:C_GCAxxG_C_C family probable redox protein
MDRTSFLRAKVHHYYWDDDVNCATAMLKVLAEMYGLELQDQVVDGALGLHGAGGFGAQCGLVEGVLLFLGILGKRQGWPANRTVCACKEFAGAFEQRFGSLLCKQLRPQGFGPHNPPHLCETLTREAAGFAADYMARQGAAPVIGGSANSA